MMRRRLPASKPVRVPLQALLLLVLTLLFNVPVLVVEAQVVSCQTDQDCAEQVRPGSTCLKVRGDDDDTLDGDGVGTCSNVFHQQGCLAQSQHLFDNDKKQVPFPPMSKTRPCTSSDPPSAALQGYCQLHDVSYPEIRIISPNWESGVFLTWILQILLGELLHVPVTVETGTRGLVADFYDPYNRLDFASDNPYQIALDNAYQYGDCRLVPNNDTDYIPCAHFDPESWDDNLLKDYAREKDSYDAPNILGVLGEQGWHIPKFTAQRDPSLLSWIGLQGNRTKLAERFQRPTTWKTYCQEVSITHCHTPDAVAQRPPRTVQEEGSYYYGADYTGYFRKTEKNDCSKYPDSCTGAFIDFPCGWHSYLEPTTYYYDIALQSDGQEPYSHGYTYREMTDIMKAANATQSDIILQWFSPDPDFSALVGTDAELLRVVMPPPTRECIENRVSPADRCSPDPVARIGKKVGACAEQSRALQTQATSNLRDICHDPQTPLTFHSPAYRALSNFRLSSWQLSDIFQKWESTNQRQGDPRSVICEWVVENMDQMLEFIPRTYPRMVVQQDEMVHNRDPLYVASVVSASIAISAVVVTMVLVYQRRSLPVFQFAQVDFLAFLLAGLALVSVGSLTKALHPTDAICGTITWLVHTGYTLELAPVIVKLEAFHQLLKASHHMRRHVVHKKTLYQAVILLTSVAVLYVIVWTILDPPKRHYDYILGGSPPRVEDGPTLVTASAYCASESEAWRYAGIAWQVCLLFWITVQVVQTRKVRRELNESKTLAMMIYSHFVFVMLRLVFIFLEYSTLDRHVFVLVQSLLMSIDTSAAIGIYFVPKLLGLDDAPPVAGYSSNVWHQQSGELCFVGNNGSSGFMVPNTSSLQSARESSGAVAQIPTPQDVSVDGPIAAATTTSSRKAGEVAGSDGGRTRNGGTCTGQTKERRENENGGGEGTAAPSEASETSV